VLRALLVTAALALGGCAGLGLSPPGAEVEFELSGRIAVRYRDESSSGNIAWRHHAGGDELLITSSLGQGVARLVREGDAFILTGADGRERRAADAEVLTEQVLGVRLPVAGLADWVRARPAPGEFESRRDAQDRLIELAQSGWKIEYLEYRDGRPSRLRLLYPGIELRLAIAEWK
jgi:outer membrane lipoprotein LolB